MSNLFCSHISLSGFRTVLLNTLFAVYILASGCSASSYQKSKASIIVITDINVVDVENGKVNYSQDVVIKDQKIVFVGDSFPEKVRYATYIQGSGKYLMPGLWDMHFHLCWQDGNDTILFPALIKSGITGIRDMGGDLKIMNAIKDRRSNGINGPKIIGAGPMIDGNPPVHRDYSLPIDSRTKLKIILDSLKAGGADFFKTYSLIKEPQLTEIAEYCRSNNIHFAGHLSEYIDPEVSITIGQKSIEHLNRLDDIWRNDQPRMERIGQMMVSNDTYLCPTLITYRLKTRLLDSSVYNPDFTKYISPNLMKEWETTWSARINRATRNNEWQMLDSIYITQKELVRFLQKTGVNLLAGSDFAGMPYVYPGIGLHEELILLGSAGLSNAEVLRTVTINAAQFLSKQHSYGSIATGKYADLIILNKNPLQEIENIKTICSVIIDGKIVI